jgi:phosphoenolpyruvate-protein phosphotransferase (PTS system enzyme I)
MTRSARPDRIRSRPPAGEAVPSVIEEKRVPTTPPPSAPCGETQPGVFHGLLRGIPVSEGIAIGKAWVLKSPWEEVAETPLTGTRHAEELNRYRKALDDVSVQLRECSDRVRRELGPAEAQIFEAHLSILNDPFFREDIPGAIRDRKRNSEFLIKEGVDRIRPSFQKMNNALFRSRIDDIQDVAERLLRILLRQEDPSLSAGENLILVAHNLTPSDTARIDRKKILGFATELGGETSHVSILARSMNLPAVVGTERLMRETASGATVVVDGNTGIVYTDPPPHVLRSYLKLKSQFKTYIRLLSREKDQPSRTLDGVDIALHANVSMMPDVHLAVRNHCSGIGLFRTELPFLTAGRLLHEDEQYQIYRTVVQAMKGRTVTIRTLDLGGDKFLPFQGIQSEINPFLGWRSIRISLQERDIFKEQIRAILRASHYGSVRILYPMISSLEELFEIRTVFQECRDELSGKKIAFNGDIQTGIMIEVPSAAIMADRLIRYTDFFSIGTNDLIQYTLAVDRNNEKVAKFYQPLNPAVLRLLQGTIRAANDSSKSVSLCGEMAGSPVYTSVLIGLGLRQFSMSPSMLMEVKERVRAVHVSECEKLVEEAMSMDSNEGVRELLMEFHREANKRQTIPYLGHENKDFKIDSKE